MRKVTKIWFSIMLLALVGCRARVVENSSAEIRESVVERVVRDSIVVHDSIYVRVGADTVFHTRYRTLYKEKLRHDTVALHDTIYIERVVVSAGNEKEGGGGVNWWLALLFLLVLWRVGVFDFLSGFFKKK